MELRRNRWMVCVLRCAACASATLLLLTPAIADHLPPKLLARGTPERTLARVTFGKTTLTQIIHTYGSPTRRLKVPNNPTWSGYIWESPNGRLEIGVDEGPKGASIGSVYVDGNGRNRTGVTGAGLKLGDNLMALKRIYGNRFKSVEMPSFRPGDRKDFMGVPGIHQIFLQWRSEEFSLIVGLDQAGKIIGMELFPPECFPDPCE